MFYKALFFRTRHGVPFQSPQRQTPDLQNYCLFGMRILEAGIYLQNDGKLPLHLEAIMFPMIA
jgi:hypothetical protein